MSNFTPGPWELLTLEAPITRKKIPLIGSFGEYGVVSGDDEEVIAHVWKLADARLIAAAPEMLDKLKAAIPYIKMANEELDSGEGGFIMALLEETIALLRRIEGEEESE